MKVLIVLCFVAGALASCPDNSHYESCGTACPLTCDNYQNPPKACVLMCNPGCHCDAGYVKTKDGQCVLPENCPSKAAGVCGANERYTPCGTTCPLTCENYDNPPKFCNFMCFIGCECAEGYVKSADGRCVLPENCPARTSERPDCDKYAEPGPCKAYNPRFFFDLDVGKCKPFVYGGCGGNRNNFETEDECYKQCGEKTRAVCDQEKVVGICYAGIRRYYFNKETRQCELFIYGGCMGTENNFKTKAECESICLD